MKLGVGPDDFVAVIGQKSTELVLGILAAVKAGGAYVPIDPAYPEERIRYMIEDCRPKAVLVYDAGEALEGIEKNFPNLPVIDLADSRACESAAQNPKRTCGPENLAYCIYTSGTTGQPKGVLVEHRGVVNLAEFYIKEHRVNSDDRILMFANYIFDASVTEITMGLLSGARLYVVPEEMRLDTAGLERYIAESHISIALMTPAYLMQLHPERRSCSCGDIITLYLIRIMIRSMLLVTTAHWHASSTLAR